MKKKVLIIVTLVICLLAVSICALADDSTLRVQASATLKAEADSAILNVGYAMESIDAKGAQQETAAIIDAIINAMKALGIEEDAIVTSSLSVYTMYDRLDDGTDVQAFRVEHLLDIKINDLSTLSNIIDTALEAGANSGLNITYYSSLSEDIYQQALAEAVSKAISKAESLAIAAGVWLGNLQQINETSTASVPYGSYGGGMQIHYDKARDASLGGSVLIGDLDIDASIELVYGVR